MWEGGWWRFPSTCSREVQRGSLLLPFKVTQTKKIFLRSRLSRKKNRGRGTMISPSFCILVLSADQPLSHTSDAAILRLMFLLRISHKLSCQFHSVSKFPYFGTIQQPFQVLVKHFSSVPSSNAPISTKSTFPDLDKATQTPCFMKPSFASSSDGASRVSGLLACLDNQPPPPFSSLLRRPTHPRHAHKTRVGVSEGKKKKNGEGRK